jgi:hypothetical protein
MAQITGQAGTNLSAELQKYLNSNPGSYTSEQLSNIINSYLTGGDKLAAQGGSVNTGIYKRFGEFDQISGKVEVVTTGLWSGDIGSLTSLNMFTSSIQEESPAGAYYTNVYNTAATSSVQFAIAYGHRLGSGSVSLEIDDNSTLATKATYAQYRSILLDQDDEKFTFLSGSREGLHDSDDIYVINIARARYRESMDAGNWSLSLNGVKFIDDSGKKFSDTAGKAGRVFNVVEGDLNLGTENEASIISTIDPTTEQGYGLFYPDMGMMVLNPTAIESRANVTVRDLAITAEGYNHRKLYDAIISGSDFQARRTENISTAHYFVRATNREYNFSNNPTFTTGSDGTFVESSFERDPKTYITTVGLYNDVSEMLAVAKTSQPIPKSFDKEILIKVKLDF